MPDPKHPEAFTEEDFNSVPALVLRELSQRGGGLLDGSLELTDEWVAPSMTEALWSVVMGKIKAQDIKPDPAVSEMADEELQVYGAAVFHKTAQRPSGCHGAFGPLGAAACEAHVLTIEDWIQRYEPEDEPEDEIELD
jgi:hypothetical protein